MNATRLHKELVAIGIVGAIALSPPTFASPIEHEVSGPGPFPYGSFVNGDISDPAKVDTYTFSGQARDHVRAVLSGLTGSFDPDLVLRSPNGALLKEA